MINRILKTDKFKVKIYKYSINQLQTFIKTNNFYNNNNKNNHRIYIKKERN
jgi:hypothetical protein